MSSHVDQLTRQFCVNVMQMAGNAAALHCCGLRNMSETWRSLSGTNLALMEATLAAQLLSNTRCMQACAVGRAQRWCPRL